MREWLKEIRESKGLKVPTIAHAAGMDASQYYKIEKGKIKRISFEVAERIAKVLNFSVYKFFEGEAYGALKVRIGQFGFSHKQLAEKLEIPESRMSEKLSGKRDFTWTEVRNICAILCIENPLDYFR